MIRNWYNQIPYSALKTKREITKYINWQQFTKGMRIKPNKQLFPRQVVSQLPKYVTHIIGGGGGGGWSRRGVLKPVLQDPNLTLSLTYS